VPKSTEHLVIVPSNIKGTGFLKNLYSKNRSFLSGLITRKEYDEIVEKAAKQTALAYSYNRKKDVEGISPAVVIALFISTVLLFCYFFLMYYGIRDDDAK
jgi:hypothetical protein